MNEVIKDKKKSEILADLIAAKPYGTTILHKEIESVIMEKYGTRKYNSEVQRTKKILEDKYGRKLESIRGDGYRLVEPDNFTEHSLRHYKRGFKEITKAHKTLEIAPVNEMSSEGRAAYQRVYDRSVLLNASLKGASVELKTLGKKEHPFKLAAGH